MTLVVSSLSLERVRVRVAAVNSGSPVDPTVDTVEMAFKQDDILPTGPDWRAATWETDTTTSPITYYARCLIGQGGEVALTPGRWDVWIRVTDTPEIPVRKVGRLTVT